MRIAYLINHYPGLSHSFIRREILALERRGIDVLRISLQGWDAELVGEEDFAERNKTRYVLREGVLSLLIGMVCTFLTRPLRMLKALRITLRMSRRSDRWLPVHLGYLAEACRVRSWLEAENIQHLHAHFGTNSAEVAMQVHALGGPPWSFTVHGPEEFEKAPIISLKDKVEDCAFAVAISSFGRSQLYRLTDHTHWPKIQVVHCGLESSYAELATSPPSIRRLICVGRLAEQKGHMILVEAARRLAQQGIAFELVLAGDGSLRPDIEAFIFKHGLQSHIRITGWISNLQARDEILAAQALVLPSFAEGLPVVIMEAMALQRPVISTFVAGIPELVKPGEHGWLVPAGDVDALAEAMRQCLDTPHDALLRMGVAARKRALERHSVDTEAAKLKMLFAHAIEENLPATPS